MLSATIIVFALAAVLGLTIAIPLLQGKPTPKPAVVLHGLAAYRINSAYYICHK